MEEENLKMTLFKSVLERIKMAVEPLHLLKNEQLNKALKKYPTLYTESVQLKKNSIFYKNSTRYLGNGVR